MATLLAFSPQVHAIDTDPGDYEAPIPGHDLGLIYVQHASRSTLYANGNKALGNARLSSDVALLRFTHPVQLGQWVFNPQFILPIARTHAGGNLSALGNAFGVGDLLLAAPLWVLVDRVERQYFCVAYYPFLPIGSYDKNKPANIGEHRWKHTFQAGAYTWLGKSDFSLDLVADVTFFGKNNQYGPTGKTLRQDLLYEVQGALSYNFSNVTRVALSLFHTWGGETRIDGGAQNNRINTDKFLLTASTFIDAQNQLLLSWGKDISVENGLKEDSRINFRYMHVY